MISNDVIDLWFIVLEYLVPSTGKLYHHKMKLRQLKAETSTEEVIEYLKKRHPLYFIADKFNPEQINDLVNRLKFKIKQLHGITSKPVTADTSKKENKNTTASASLAISKIATTAATSSLLGPLPSIGNKISTAPSFKSGSQLPSISNEKKSSQPPPSLFPPHSSKQQSQ